MQHLLPLCIKVYCLLIGGPPIKLANFFLPKHQFQSWIMYGKTPQIPSVGVFCNPRTVDLTCTFQEQLIVPKNRFLAAQNKNSISQAAQKNILLRAAQNNIGCFSHVTKQANMRVKNTSFQSNTKLLIFCWASQFVVLSVSHESRICSNSLHS